MGVLLDFMQEFVAILDERSALRKRVAELEAAPSSNKPKLTERDVKDIREAFRGGVSQKSLSDAYEVNPATISRTVRGFYH